MQAPAAHPDAAWASLQTIPHPPQLFGSVVSGTSQPSAAIPLQSPKPMAHAYPQVVAMQVDVALAGGTHARPQLPQLAADIVRSVSQPLDGSMSQSPIPVLQLYPQALPVQAGDAPATAGQTVPQVPQCVGSEVRSASHPSDAIPLQSPAPALHAKPHTPAAHVDVARGGVLHVVPQAPQWMGEDVRSVSQPLETMRSQSARPGAHAAILHVPEVHAGVAKGGVQGIPQPPQALTSVRVFAQAPVQQVCAAGQGCDVSQPCVQALLTHRSPTGH